MRLRTLPIALLLAMLAACASPPDVYDAEGPRPDAGLGGTGIVPTLPR